jgi:serine/threonine-protein phosphatase 2A activator
MYDKEVLSKFPVVQHFSFGSIFRWSTIDTSQPGASTPRASDRSPVRGGGNADVDEAGATFATSSITASKSGSESITTRAPWAPPQQPAHPASARVPTSRLPPTAQPKALILSPLWPPLHINPTAPQKHQPSQKHHHRSTLRPLLLAGDPASLCLPRQQQH